MFTYVASGALGIGGRTPWAASPWSYTASGKLSTRMCGAIVIFSPIPYCPRRFNPGDLVYLQYKAIKGILEYVVIKKLKIVDRTIQGYGQCVTLYVDTWNALYNEDDLVTLEEANSLISTYQYNQRLNAQKAGCLR